MLSNELKQKILKDIRAHYIGKGYNYERVFIDSGDCNGIGKYELDDFIDPILDDIEDASYKIVDELIAEMEKK